MLVCAASPEEYASHTEYWCKGTTCVCVCSSRFIKGGRAGVGGRCEVVPQSLWQIAEVHICVHSERLFSTTSHLLSMHLAARYYCRILERTLFPSPSWVLA